MSKKLTFQEIILTLQQYWNDGGQKVVKAYGYEDEAVRKFDEKKIAFKEYF